MGISGGHFSHLIIKASLGLSLVVRLERGAEIDLRTDLVAREKEGRRR